MDTEAVRTLLRESAYNGLGERVTLVAATKTRTAEEIREAIAAGITDVGENRVQEFREKSPLLPPVRRHFIGRLQTNKVKYLVGQCDLIQSLDRDALAEALSLRAQKLGIVQDVLLEVNAGEEASKGGYLLSEAYEAYARIRDMKGIRPKGLMTVLPETEDRAWLQDLCGKMRELFETIRKEDREAEHLSMGMSGDWRLCLACGSNMIRLGTAIFGARPARPV